MKYHPYVRVLILLFGSNLFSRAQGHQRESRNNHRQARDVVVSCTRLKCTRLQHRTCKTCRGHFASLVVSKKVPATWWDFRSSFQKNCLLPGGIFARSFKKSACYLLGFLFFFPILKLEVGFFSDRKSFSQNG